MIEINIKKDMPPSKIAIAFLDTEIRYYKNTPEKVLKVIHGYGSHGKGGEIKKELSLYLKDMLSKKQIFGYIKGECFGESNELVKYAYSICPELILDNDLKNYNSGLTIILL